MLCFVVLHLHVDATVARFASPEAEKLCLHIILSLDAFRTTNGSINEKENVFQARGQLLAEESATRDSRSRQDCRWQLTAQVVRSSPRGREAFHFTSKKKLSETFRAEEATITVFVVDGASTIKSSSVQIALSLAKELCDSLKGSGHRL